MTDLKGRIIEIMRDQLTGDEERNPAGVPIYGIDEAADAIMAEFKRDQVQAIGSPIFVRDCSICSDQPKVPPDCPACHGAGGFNRCVLTAVGMLHVVR